ncbi:MAG: glycosyltransferase family 2 protein [Bacteroidales bacterium]|nr:glycosyltransferase family 2 protein [Bacteroidales bacterium]
MEKISIIIPVYNEEENIVPLTEELHKVLQGYDFEIIFVDDGSVDRTAEKIQSLKKKNITLIEFTKNFGQSLAMAAGIDYAKGEFIVTMDGDLQNDPADIPEMLKKLKDEGWDMVTGYRQKRKDPFFSRILPSQIANFIIRMLTGVHFRDYGCTLKVFRADLAKKIELYGELHRFIPVLAAFEGARITQMPVNHHPRHSGRSKYGIGRTFRVMSDLLLILFLKKYFLRPMHLFGTTGVIVLLAGVLINLYLLGMKILGNDIWGKPLLFLAILLVIGGIQLITIGIFAEFLMRIYFRSSDKLPYRIKKITTGKQEE